MENEYLIRFKKPYRYEEAEYKEIDLSGLESLTAKDLIDAEKQFAANGQIAAINEMNIGYVCIVAAKASGKPVEFFETLPANEAIKVKNAVTNFFYA
jgi:hypothetical protein